MISDGVSLTLIQTDSCMRSFFLIFFLNFLVITPVFGQKTDSLKLAEAFTKALSSPGEKDVYLKQALELKNKRNSKYLNEVYAYWNARYLFYTGQLDEAEKVVVEQLKVDAEPGKKAKFHNILGTVNTLRQDYKKAISWYEEAINDYESADNQKGVALVKLNIANIFFSLSDFETAYKYIRESHLGLQPFNDTVNKVNVLGILSISEAKTGRYKEATRHAKKILELANKQDNKNGVALAYLSLGETALSEEEYEEAIRFYSQTDSVATSVRNANLSHLAHVGMLSTYVSLKNYAKAKEIGEMALDELGMVPNKTTEYVIRRNLAEAYAGIGEYKKAFQFQFTADSIYKVTSSMKNKEYINELLIRHDTQRKESQLKIEQNENLIKEERLKQQGWIVFALALVLLIAILVFVGYRRNQRNRLKQLRAEQENELMRALIDGEEKERERVANELHDGLASDLTGIKMVLSQTTSDLPDGVLNALSRVHEQTRRISHNLSPLNLEKLGLVSALKNFTQENSTEQVKIHFYASKDHVNIEPIQHATLIYRVCQELIQNALKHAESTVIDVQLMISEEELTINIEDNGCGFDVASKAESFGLMNVRKQVELLKGELSIDSRPQNGTVVFLSLPIV